MDGIHHSKVTEVFSPLTRGVRSTLVNEDGRTPQVPVEPQVLRVLLYGFIRIMFNPQGEKRVVPLLKLSTLDNPDTELSGHVETM